MSAKVISTTVPRLFTALTLPGTTLQQIEHLLSRLRPMAPLAWSPPANLHITIKFIGTWPAERMAELQSALALAALTQGQFTVELASVGYFPNAHEPRVLYLGVTRGQSLSALAAATERHLAPIGIASETRPYSPHLTLARIRRRTSLDRLTQELKQVGPVRFGPLPVSAFTLYRSEPATGGSLYHPLQTFALPSTLVKCLP